MNTIREKVSAWEKYLWSQVKGDLDAELFQPGDKGSLKEVFGRVTKVQWGIVGIALLFMVYVACSMAAVEITVTPDPTATPVPTITPEPTPPPIVSPSGVLKLRVVDASADSVTLQWEPPVNSDRAAVEQYIVTRDVPLGRDEHYFVAETTFTATGLRSGREHKYRVRALGRDGLEGPEVGIVARTTEPEPTATAIPESTATPAPIPGVVQDLRVVNATESSVTLQWEPPANSDAVLIEGYEVFREVSLGRDVREFVVGPTFIEVGLMGGREYKYQVKALGQRGGIGYELAVVARTLEPEASATATPVPIPGVVRDLRVVNATESSVTLQWEPPANSDAVLIEGYEVFREVSLGRDVREFVVGPTFTEVGLMGGREYKYQVKALGQRGGIGYELAVVARTLEPEESATATPVPDCDPVAISRKHIESVDSPYQNITERAEAEQWWRDKGCSEETIARVLVHFEKNVEKMLKWRATKKELDSHWANIDALYEYINRVNADRVIDRRESEQICFLEDQWTAQLNAAIEFVQSLRREAPELLKNYPPIEILEREATKYLDVFIGAIDCVSQ